MDVPPWLLEVALLTGGYWLIDRAVREEGWAKILSTWAPARRLELLIAIALGASWLTDWSALPGADALRVVSGVLVGVMAWKAATKDIDVVTGEHHHIPRLALALSAVGVWFEPAALFVALVLLTTPFKLWQHHATLPMRDLQAIAAFVLLSAAGLLDRVGVLFWFLLVIHISHYLMTALAKMYLGPRPWSWVLDNHIHHLAASAYSWGWARFIPWPQWRRFIHVLQRSERPAQAYAFGVELFAPLALLHPAASVAFCAMWSMFHLGVFAASGLLFWDWISANVALGIGLWLLPPNTRDALTGVGPMLGGVAFLVLFPLRHKLWKPMPLGWWDTPLTQRIRWQVQGDSGAIYGLYNDYMDPHERIYGKVHGCFLVPAPVCTYHLGEVYKHDLRDAIRAAGPSLAGLAPVRERFGILPRSEALADQHRAYLRAFFTALRRGAKKHVLPPGLRWLKAPGGQIFYWGDLPRYTGQEPITSVSLYFREEYFDGDALVRLRDDLIEEIPITPLPEDAPTPTEPTPKDLDRFLLGFARGRLVDLPDFADGFIGGDDGISSDGTSR